MIEESLLKKVRGLLSRTIENGCSVHEAATAAKTAQRLIEEHNLSMAEVENFSDNESIKEHGAVISGTRLPTWKSGLLNVLAKTNACFVFTKRNIDGRSVNIVGRHSDVQIVSYMFSVISREVERLCKIEKERNHGHGKTWTNSFKIGAVHAIEEGLKKAQKEARQNAQTSAIVKVEQKYEDTVQWVSDNMSHLQKGGRKTYRKDERAYKSGYKAGKNIHTNAGLNPGKTTNKLR